MNLAKSLDRERRSRAAQLRANAQVGGVYFPQIGHEQTRKNETFIFGYAENRRYGFTLFLLGEFRRDDPR